MSDSASNRAGKYVLQPDGYSSFVPSSLPPVPPVQVILKLQKLLSEADDALGRLDGSVLTLPNPDLFVFMYVRKEAVLSSQIEGTQSSLQDVLAAEAKILNPQQPRDVNEVINYITAMNYGLERLKKLPVSVRLIREIHAKLLHGVRGGMSSPGELRDNQNWIGSEGSTIYEATFVPPPPNIVQSALSNLERFLHTKDDLPLLIKIGIAHAQFETIHPFLDGNGRIGRLLISFILVEKGRLKKPVLYLSHYFKLYRSSYYEYLQKIRDTGDWEGWIEFFLKGITKVSRQATITARNILQLRETLRDRIITQLGRAAANGLKVFENLFQRPIISVKDVKVLVKTSYPAANHLIQRLVKHGVIREITGHARNRRFIFQEYVSLFTDEEARRQARMRVLGERSKKVTKFSDEDKQSKS